MINENYILTNNFEQIGDFFLEKGITSSKLSSELGTNTTYLSQFLKEYKGSNFNTYINIFIPECWN